MGKKHWKYPTQICFVCEKAVEIRLFKDGNITCRKCMRVTSSFEEKDPKNEQRNYWALKKYYRKKRIKTQLPKIGVWYWRGRIMEKDDIIKYVNRNKKHSCLTKKK